MKLKILLVGYGKMGKVIEKIALEKGHTIVGIIDQGEEAKLKKFTSKNVDVAIEFTQPDSAPANIRTLLKHQIPVVSGTTGWLSEFEKIKSECLKLDGAFFYATNYSIGMNLFLYFNDVVSRVMNKYHNYDVEIHEIHHKEKKDSPSGSSITLANQILANLDRKDGWKNSGSVAKNDLSILSFREKTVPGTHSVIYSSDEDNIELKHLAHNRFGFGSGAVAAAEWLVGKKGVFGMKNMLELQ